ncbi:MAG: rod shape-determining protein MreC [Coriobacteriales bacterium]|jgi:rod shape-determining protein MreC|nr:rod shape-determining protein MreC [Coriobacteriales bacterium]
MPQLAKQKDIHHFPPLFLAVICVLFSIILLTVWSLEGATGPLHQLKNGAGLLCQPFQTLGSFIRAPFVALGNSTANLSIGSGQIAQIENDNQQLQSDNSKLQEYSAENAQLRGLLQMSDLYGFTSVGARVISEPTDPYNQVLTLDRGSLGGVSVGMPVISGSGLVGQVETVSLTSCTVRLLTDAKSGVAALTQKGRVQGILGGSVSGALTLNYVPLTAKVAVGDSLVTSGLGGTYPKGIMLGTVQAVSSAPTDLYQTIKVTPTATTQSAEDLAIVTASPAEVSAATKSAAKASDAR